MGRTYTALETREIESLPTVAYWSAVGGVEVKKIEHGIEDYVVCVSNAWTKHSSVHRLRVRYTQSKIKDPRPYIMIHGYMLYLDECIRT